MKIKLICILNSTMLLTLLWTMPSLGQMSSSLYWIPTQVLDGGGSQGSSASFRLIGAIGQSTAIGSSQSMNFINKAGFIPQVDRARGDVNGDGEINEDDYQTFLTAYGSCSGSANFIPAADLDGDGCIRINDYRILRSLL